MNENRFVDLSGYGIAGKGAFTALMREFKDYDVPKPYFEFSLIRIKDGLLDLENALTTNWSPVRCDVAIKRFKKIIYHLGANPNKTNLYQSFKALGVRYNDEFSNKFIEISEDYIEDLIEYKYYSPLVYPMQDDSIGDKIFKKVLNRLGKKDAFSEENYLSTGENFIPRTIKYLNDLFNARNNTNGVTYVMHNAFEVFAPQNSMRFFNDARCIIMDRDPRDVFLSALTHKVVHDVPTDVDLFIHKYKLYKKQVNIIEDKNILRLNFEDLVMDYDNALLKIYTCLGETISTHINKGKYFNPENSKKAVGLWKKVDNKNKSKVDKIFTELKDYCKDYTI